MSEKIIHNVAYKEGEKDGNYRIKRKRHGGWSWRLEFQKNRENRVEVLFKYKTDNFSEFIEIA